MSTSLLPFLHRVPVTETAATAAALEPQLAHKDDIKVNCGQWKWSPTEEWPPISVVKGTPFWSSGLYANIRGGLLKPLAEPSLTIGAEYVTLDTIKRSVEQREDSSSTQEPVVQPTPSATPSVPLAQPSVTVRRDGVVNICGLQPGQRVPHDLVHNIKYQLIFVEAELSDSGDGLHSVIPKYLVGHNAPVWSSVGRGPQCASWPTTQCSSARIPCCASTR